MADYTEDGTPDEKEIKSSAAKRKLCQVARERYTYGRDKEAHNRKAAREDTKFVYVPGAQWPDNIRNERETISNEPCLEFNQTKQFTNSVINDMRQKRPGVRVHAAGGKATVQLAKKRQSLMRGIEYVSKAEAIYDQGYLHTVVGGLGAWRVVTEYENDKDFKQVARIKGINDPGTVTPDPDYQEPDASDMNWCFIEEMLDKEAFERDYPDAAPLNWQSPEFGEWFSDDRKQVKVADYYCRKVTKRTLVMMNDDSIGFKDELPKKLPIIDGVQVKIQREREVDFIRVEIHKLAGGEQVLSTTEWPGKTIPVVLDIGDEIMIDGKRYRQGLIRHSRDSQSLLNFGLTAQAIQLSLEPRAPWIMAEGQDEGHEEMWRTANRRNYGRLVYKPVMMEDGETPAPSPQRVLSGGPGAGWQQMFSNLNMLLKSTMGGIYDPSLGNRSNETSGRAILAREQQGDNATFHYADNHSRAIALTGKIINEIVPTIYGGEERQVQGINDEDKQEVVDLNKRVIDAQTLESGVDPQTDMELGEFTMTIEAGETWASKRMENAEKMTELVGKFPDIMSVAGDLVVGTLEIDDAEEIAERLEVMLPPAIQQMRAAKAQGQDPKQAQMMAQLEQLAQENQQLQQMIQMTTQELEQVKKDKTAQIQASQAKVAESQDNVESNREKNAIAKDMAMIKLIDVILKYQLQDQKQVNDAALASSTAMTVNDGQGA